MKKKIYEKIGLYKKAHAENEKLYYVYEYNKQKRK